MSDLIVIRDEAEPPLQASFLVALREYSRKLTCRFDRLAGKWMIYERRNGDEYHLLTIEDEKGRAIEPGEWVINALKQLDFARGSQKYKNTRFFFRQIRERNEELQKKISNAQREETKDFVMREILPPTPMIIKTRDI